VSIDDTERWSRTTDSAERRVHRRARLVCERVLVILEAVAVACEQNHAANAVVVSRGERDDLREQKVEEE
jgi:hypothetical protein